MLGSLRHAPATPADRRRKESGMSRPGLELGSGPGARLGFRLGALSIRAKLVAVLSLFMAAMIGMGLSDLYSIRTIHGLMGEVQHNWMPGVRWATMLEASMGGVRDAVFGHILASDEESMAEAEKRYAEALKAAATVQGELERRIASPEEKAALEAFKSHWQAYQEALKDIFTYSRQYAKEAAAKFYNETAAAPAAKAIAAAEAIVQIKTRGADAANRRADAAAAATLKGLAISLPLTLLLALAAAWGLIRSIGRGIASVVAPMRALAAGNLAVDIPHRGENNEIGSIADAVHVFKEALVEKQALDEAASREGQARLRRAQALDALLARFEASVGGFTQALSASSDELEATARSLTDTAEETSRQAGGASASADQTSLNVQTVAAATEELAASIREITRQMQDSSSTASRAVENVERADAIIQELAAATQKIGSVVALISGVASQTNLLALNATIEAARAGEAGKGFAVVASEVKALANQTTAATNEIAGQIEQIQASTTSAVAAIREVAAVIAAMNETAVAVAAAMDEQGMATEEIASNVQQAAAGTQQVSASMHGLKGAAREAGEAASRVLEAARDVARHSGDLRRELQGFLSDVKAA